MLAPFPVRSERFDPSEAKAAGVRTPFLHELELQVKLIRARRFALAELPEVIADGAVTMRLYYDFRGAGYPAQDYRKVIPFAVRLAKAMGHSRAVEALSLLDGAVNAHVAAEERGGAKLERDVDGDPVVPIYELAGNHPDMMDALEKLFGDDATYIADVEKHVDDRAELNFLKDDDYFSLVKQRVLELDDYWERPHQSWDLSETSFELCRALDARIVRSETRFDYPTMGARKVNVMQGGKVLTSFLRGSSSVHNAFGEDGLIIDGLNTTKGYFWQVIYRDTDQLMDPATHEVIAQIDMPDGKLKRPGLWMRDEAPSWHFTDKGRRRELHPPGAGSGFAWKLSNLLRRRG